MQQELPKCGAYAEKVQVECAQAVEMTMKKLEVHVEGMCGFLLGRPSGKRNAWKSSVAPSEGRGPAATAGSLDRGAAETTILDSPRP